MAPQFVDDEADGNSASKYGSNPKESTNHHKMRAQVTTGLTPRPDVISLFA